MDRSLIEKVIRRHGLEEAVEKLADVLNTSELTSVLAEVFSRRQQKMDASTLGHVLQNNRFCRPSDVDPRIYHAFDTIAYQCLPENFQPMELSPLAPLGTVGILANVDHGSVVQTIRSQEVMSDCTNVMGIHAASLRRNSRTNNDINLSTTARLVRAQLPSQKHHTGHFRILTLLTAGRDEGSYHFEKRQVIAHINFYLNLIRSFENSKSNIIQLILKEYADTGIEWQEVVKACDPFNIQFEYRRMDRPDWHYYAPFQFNINIETPHGMLNLADGGMVDWTQKLLSDRKERCMISGFGTELFCKLFLERA